MDTLVGLLFFCLLVFGLFALLRSHWRRDSHELWRLRRASLAQYRRLRIEGTPERYGFDARRAEVVLDREDIVRNRGGIANYCLVRYARNAQGEYFMFASNPEGAGYIKHVMPDIARVALKDRFVAPPPT